MNITSFPRIAVLSLALGTAGLTASFAQAQSTDDTNTPTTPSSSKHFHHHDGGVLTPDERAELKKDYQDALAANAQLKTQQDALKQQQKALHEQEKALHKQIHDAIVAEDANAQAIFDKLAAAHKDQGGWHHHHHDGGNSSTDSSTDTSSDSSN